MKMSSTDLPVVCFDCDGVLADLATIWFETHNRSCIVCTEPLVMDRVVRWNTHEFTACGTGVYRYLNDAELWKRIKPVPGAQETIRCLSWMKILRPVVVTTISQGPVVRAERIAWIRKYFPWIDPGAIVITKDKDCVRGDMLIDDALHNLYNFSGRRVVLDYPYNREPATTDAVEWNVFGTITRVRDWYQLGKLLYRIYGKGE